MILASARERNHSRLRHSSRNLPLKLSLTPFCHGLPGSIRAVCRLPGKREPRIGRGRIATLETDRPVVVDMIGNAQHTLVCELGAAQRLVAVDKGDANEQHWGINYNNMW